MTSAKLGSAGIASSRRLRASRPPADDPTPTIGKRETESLKELVPRELVEIQKTHSIDGHLAGRAHGIGTPLDWRDVYLARCLQNS